MLIDDLRGVRVLVVGDVMLDHYVEGVATRVSPEAPALVLSISDEHRMLGGAANVAANITSVGGIAVLVGVIGVDSEAVWIAELASAFGSAIVDAMVRSPTNRTTAKTRFVAGDRHLLRADSETLGMSADAEAAVVAAIASHAKRCDAIVVSDYAKGVASPTVLAAAITEGKAHGIPVVVDPKRPDFAAYAGADLITPNRRELAAATGEACDDLASCDRAARTAIAQTGAAVLLTRAEDGVALFEPGVDVWSDGAHARAVRDVSGAGDTVLAVGAAALAAGATLVEAARLANVAAGVVVGKSGTSCITADELNLGLLYASEPDDLSGKLVSANSAVLMRERWRDAGLAVGFTNGCFDLVHPGHIKLLAEARRTCDRLVVGLNTDASIRRLKGTDRPIQTELARAEVIGAMRQVDLVVLFDDDTPLALIADLRPDVLIKGADYTHDTVVGADCVAAWGGRVELIPLVPGESSSRLIGASRKRGAPTV